MVFISSKPKSPKGLARVKVNDSGMTHYDHGHIFTVLFEAQVEAKVDKKTPVRHLDSDTVKEVLRWVEGNKDVLLDYWHERNTDTLDVLSKLKPLSQCP